VIVTSLSQGNIFLNTIIITLSPVTRMFENQGGQKTSIDYRPGRTLATEVFQTRGVVIGGEHYGVPGEVEDFR
jgi:hypothetical protein